MLTSQVPLRENRFLLCIIAGMVFAMGISAYHPTMIIDWWLENILVFVLLIALAATYKTIPLSSASYLLLFLFLCFHEWGAHHKYADVPLGEWIKVWLHTSRNHYDRVMHVAFGLFFSYPMMEAFMHTTGVRNKWRYWLPIEASLALGAIYEMIESLVASIVSPDAGEAFVGMQGDMWDAQKDMGLGMLGAIVAMLILWLIESRYAKAQQVH